MDLSNLEELDRKVRNYFDRMELEEFIAIISAKKYKPSLHIVDYKDKNVQAMEDKNYVLANFSEVVYEYLKEFNRMPTPKEFANYSIQIIYDRLERDGVTITEEVLKALHNRRVNSYVSFINEIHTRKLMEALLPSDYYIMSSAEMDLKHGVDIIVRNWALNKEAYLHVTSNTAYARERAIQKGNKFGRDFTGHIWLYYDKKNVRQSLDASLPLLETDTTIEHNGFFLFKEEYIQDKIDYIIYKMNKKGIK